LGIVICIRRDCVVIRTHDRWEKKMKLLSDVNDEKKMKLLSDVMSDVP